jgi:hypothetical protein
MDYLFCFQRPFFPRCRSVETVDDILEFSPAFSPVRWLSDGVAICANIFLQITAAR